DGIRDRTVTGVQTCALPICAAALRIFEVDQPASQQAKRDALASASLQIPANTVFVPVNFQSESLSDRLEAAGFAASAPAFVSWQIGRASCRGSVVLSVGGMA